jgi:cobyrinic acid a,c-diamide synthase
MSAAPPVRVVTVPRLVVAAPRSGEGKTTVALGIMAALRRRGLRVQGYKVGPDYLDTGYQQYAAGPAGSNLDLFMMGEDAVLDAVAAADADVAVIEGVMGLFDGHRDGVTPTSTADVAARLRAPVVLVLDASRMAASAGAVALGFKSFDPAVDVAGVLLNRWNPSRSRAAVEAALARAGVAALGYLPVAGDLELPSRHLGLVVADELGAEVAQVMDRLGEWVEEHADVDRLLALARTAPEVGLPDAAAGAAPPPVSAPAAAAGPRIAVAWDAAFAFYYADNLALLRARGADLVFFSPLEAAELPVCDGLYLGGGYPELHAAGLSANESLRRDIAASIARGLPTYAECGGLLYLCESLVDLDGRTWPLVGAVPGRAAMHERLQGMGYREGVLAGDSLLGQAGATVRGHEFHYSTCDIDRPAGPTSSPADGPSAGSAHPAYIIDGAPEGYAAGALFASYVHLHFAGYPALLDRWLERCRAHSRSVPSGGPSA